VRPISLVACLLTFGTGMSHGQAPLAQREIHMQTFEPAPVDDVLLNPGMGLYMQHPPTDLHPDHWMNEIADIAYYRLDWAEVNPQEGAYTFEEYFGPLFELWVNRRGKRVAFRVMCENTHSRRKYVTPQWVFDRGVPGVRHVGLYAEEQINPVFWDERYLDLQCEFIQRLGRYLNGREGLEFVDIGSIGEWGEMHLGLHMPGRWTPEMLEQTGYTHAKYVMAYRRVIDAFARAFPDTRVFLNVGGHSNLTINDYAALRAVHFRQDGLTPAGASANVGDWLYRPYSDRGVICNLEFHSGYRSMQQKGWDLRATIDKGLEAPISYLNTNLGTFGDVPEQVRTELTRAARKVGYRFVLTSLQHLPEFHLDGVRPGRVPLIANWRNDGVAPCHESFAIEWALADEQGAIVAAETTFPQVPTTRWRPGQLQRTNAMPRVPADTAPGSYRLKVSLVMPQDGRRIRLGIAGRDDECRYDLCRLTGVRAAPAQSFVYQEDFETEEGLWTVPDGMQASIDAGRAHSRDSSMLITGRHEKGWNYAVHTLPTPAIPGARYKLTAWMMVQHLEPAGSAPYVKIGVNDTEGKWIANFTSEPYDMARAGAWQKLQVTVDVPVNAAFLHLAVEKGAYSTPIQASIYFDDVSVELLQAP